MTRETLIAHILMMRQYDPDYARYALRWYADLMPWLRLNAAVREALG